MMKLPLACLALATAIGCSSTPPARIDMAPALSDLKISGLVRSAMVRTVSLPTYAAAEEVAFETPQGLISQNANLLWADDPSRAVTLTLSRHLDHILTTNVGPDPWPFIGLPDIGIDIRVSRMIAGGDGNFNLEGQYYIGGDGIDFPNTANGFTIRVPLVNGTSAGIAQAQATALLQLSEHIARRLGR